MAYYSGTASSLADLRTALLTHAVSDGWTLTGDVLSKAGVYFQIQVTAENVTCLGCESNAVGNPAPNVVAIGLLWKRSGYTTRAMSFPCNYEVFGFAQELYLVANYDVDSYQWMAFGKSAVPGLPGQGGWCAASSGNPAAGGFVNNTDAVSISASTLTQSGTGSVSAWPFYAFSPSGYTSRSSWVNHGLDGHGWTYNGSPTNDTPIGARHLLPLVGLQPSVWNSETVLLPIKCYKQRPSFKSSLIADLAHARMIRIDNLQPGDVLTLGSDQWKCFPLYRKNAATRDAGASINHTGTFGWAIRYEGP